MGTPTEELKTFWSRIRPERFETTLPMTIDKEISQIENTHMFYDRWDTRTEGLLSCIGYVIGLGNVWRFPLQVYKNGGGSFLIPYYIFCFFFGVPLVILEMGLGQFSCLGCTKVFKCVPVLYGIGWAQVILSAIMMIYYSVIIAWAYLYLLHSFSYSLSWTSCNNTFNSKTCVPTYSQIESNSSNKLTSSSEEFFNRYVTGFETTNGTFYTMDQFPGWPQWHLSLCMLIVWTLAVCSVAFGVKISGKVVYVTVILPYVSLIFLILLGCTLPGAFNGLKFYLKPNMTLLMDMGIYFDAFEQYFFSLGTAIGGLITLSSHNSFHDNFYRDAVIIVMVDCFTSFISGLAVFPLVGYVAQRTNKHIEQVISGETTLYFVIYPEALSTLTIPNLWIIIFMVMTILMGMDSHFTILQNVIAPIGDQNINRPRTHVFRVLGVILISIVSYLFGLLLITPGGLFYFVILDTTIAFYGLPLIAIIECMTIGIVYGRHNFRRDLKMMTGFAFNNYYFIIMTYICPACISFLLLGNIIKSKTIKVHGKPVSLWGQLMSYIMILIILAPIIYGAIYISLRYKSRYTELTLEQYLSLLVSPPIYYGPKFKVNWLLHKDYKDKLLKYSKHRKFMKHNHFNENIKLIIKTIKKANESNKIKKIQLKKQGRMQFLFRRSLIHSTSSES